MKQHSKIPRSKKISMHCDPGVTVVKVQIPCAFQWIAGKQVSVVGQVGGNLDDLVAITFLQKKFQAWAVAKQLIPSIAVARCSVHMSHYHPLLGFVQYGDVAPCQRLQKLDRSDNRDSSLQGSHACCLLRHNSNETSALMFVKAISHILQVSGYGAG